jgi:predicted small integral membrane protein
MFATFSAYWTTWTGATLFGTSIGLLACLLWAWTQVRDRGELRDRSRARDRGQR